MEIARYWRLNKERLRFTARRRILKDGTEQISISGSWPDLPKREGEIIIFQAADSELVSAK
jgi:hypothetical protein